MFYHLQNLFLGVFGFGGFCWGVYVQGFLSGVFCPDTTGPLWFLSYKQQSLAYSNMCYLLWSHVECGVIFFISLFWTFEWTLISERVAFCAIGISENVCSNE